MLLTHSQEMALVWARSRRNESSCLVYSSQESCALWRLSPNSTRGDRDYQERENLGLSWRAFVGFFWKVAPVRPWSLEMDSQTHSTRRKLWNQADRKSCQMKGVFQTSTDPDLICKIIISGGIFPDAPISEKRSETVRSFDLIPKRTLLVSDWSFLRRGYAVTGGTRRSFPVNCSGKDTWN